jgi:signal transduction histidine kinase
VTKPAAAPDITGPSTWERRLEALADYSAYVLLTFGFALVMAQPQSQQDRVIAVLLSLVAAAWITLYLRVPAFHGERTVPSLIYYFGFLAIAAVMMLHHPMFFPVMIVGFFHVHMFSSWQLTLLGVGLTSFLLNALVIDRSDVAARPTADEIAGFVVIVVVQTLAIGGGVIFSRRAADVSEERRRAVAELQAALEENEGLHTQLMIQAREAGVLDERQRLAREIHDTLAQGLTGIITQLEAATRARDDGEGQRRRIDTAMRLARESLADARRSVQALGPEPLDEARLPEALAQVGKRWSVTNGLAAEVTTTGTSRPLHPTIEVTLLRVAQEALANVAKHARASRAAVTLSYTDKVVLLDVRDDGVGFTPRPGTNDGWGSDGGFGLTAMRQRIDEVAGTLVIESEAGAGTSISASVPVAPPELQGPQSKGAADA